jgi:hypothetical protein
MSTTDQKPTMNAIQDTIRSMAARMFARNARRNPARAERWLAVYERYEGRGAA